MVDGVGHGYNPLDGYGEVEQPRMHQERPRCTRLWALSLSL